MTRYNKLQLAFTVCLLLLPRALVLDAYAEERGLGEFSELSIEELVNQDLSIISSEPLSVMQSPAAVYVFDNEAIRRLGVTHLPEILRN